VSTSLLSGHDPYALNRRVKMGWLDAYFAGTRVPVQNLFDYLEEGDSLEVFLKQFPSVTREQAIAVLERARTSLVPDAHPA
jgi:uncharacterized protein (DUF433 family)